MFCILPSDDVSAFSVGKKDTQKMFTISTFIICVYPSEGDLIVGSVVMCHYKG